MRLRSVFQKFNHALLYYLLAIFCFNNCRSKIIQRVRINLYKIKNVVYNSASTSIFRYQVVIMVVSDINKLDMVWQWRKQGIDFWNKVNVINHPIQAMIPPHIREPFLNFLDAQYIYHEILIPDVEL